MWTKGDMEGGVGKKKKKGVEPEEGCGLGAPPISTGEDHLADCPGPQSPRLESGAGSGPCTHTAFYRRWGNRNQTGNKGVRGRGVTRELTGQPGNDGRVRLEQPPGGPGGKGWRCLSPDRPWARLREEVPSCHS